MQTLAVKILIIVMGIIALFMTFRAKFILEKILRKEATEKAILRVKYAALAVAVIVFVIIFITDFKGV